MSFTEANTMVQVLDMIIHNGKVKLQPSSLAIELDQHVPSFLTSNSSSSLLASMGLRVDPESTSLSSGPQAEASLDRASYL